jgi:hypothetical protein
MKLNLNRETQKEENECESLRLFYCLHILHQIIELMSRFFFARRYQATSKKKKSTFKNREDIKVLLIKVIIICKCSASFSFEYDDYL